ncbi:MAG: PadR family transcriptional regulator [Micrococcus sp.]|nr:PadR family transcriptional regulator [Micrococcus sp.]
MHHAHRGPAARMFQQFFDLGMRPHGHHGPGPRARRGDVRTAILLLLAEEPMHGYQIIRELGERSGGVWTPSAGSVYPTLQMLADEGLIDAEQTGGKKVYRLTEEGSAAAANLEGEASPWQEAASSLKEKTAFEQSAAKLAQSVFQVGTAGTEAQRAAAVEVLDEARRKLYGILAQD